MFFIKQRKFMTRRNFQMMFCQEMGKTETIN